MKKLLSLLLALCLCFLSVSALAEAAVTQTDEQPALPEGLIWREYSLCMSNPYTGVPTMSTETGVFQENDPAILFMSMREFAANIAGSAGITEPVITCDADSLTVTRDNGSSVIFLREENTFYYSDIDLFTSSPYATCGGDFISTAPYRTNMLGGIIKGDDGEPLVNLIARQGSEVTTARAGDMIGASLDDYEIPVYWTEDDIYLPVNVLTNLFPFGTTTSMIYLNGVLYLTVSGIPDDNIPDESGKTMADYYYAAGAGDRPQSLVELNYNLLCLELDLNYGLKDEHGITDGFDSYLATIGLKDQMLQADGKAFYDALDALTLTYFGDGHSILQQAGPYAGRDYFVKLTTLPLSYQPMLTARTRFGTARTEAGLGVSVTANTYAPTQPFQVVGDTAYLTFDSFVYQQNVNYYGKSFQASIADLIGQDTIALVNYANSQINQEGSTIRRVVVDLSCNGGGNLDAAVFLVSWMLGDCKLSTSTPVTGASYTVTYKADVNLDGKITDEDHLSSDIELYCIISPVTFSSANLTAALLKQSNVVTILGQTSGGGACAVQPCVTVDGTVFQYSGHRVMCTVKNGTYTSVDQGVTPHYELRKTAHFYDREWLTDYIASIP